MPALTLNDIKDKTVVMIGSTAGYLSSKQLAEKLSKYNTTIKTQFTKDVSVAFYNPRQVSGDKIKEARKYGIKMFTYDEVKTFVDQLSENPSLVEEPDAPKPLVKGQYLGTKPYLFKNIIPVLEPGHPTPSIKYYLSEKGNYNINNAFRKPGGLQRLSDIERQYIEDIILHIQVKGKYYDTLYKGISDPDEIAFLFKAKVGDTFVKQGFFEAASSEEIAMDISNWDSSSRAVMIYFDPSAKVKAIGVPPTYGNKNDILLLPGCSYKITDIEDEGIDESNPSDSSKKKRKIYARLFINPMFNTLNKAASSLSNRGNISNKNTTGRIIRDPELMEPFARGEN